MQQVINLNPKENKKHQQLKTKCKIKKKSKFVNKIVKLLSLKWNFRIDLIKYCLVLKLY